MWKSNKNLIRAKLKTMKTCNVNVALLFICIHHVLWWVYSGVAIVVLVLFACCRHLQGTHEVIFFISFAVPFYVLKLSKWLLCALGFCLSVRLIRFSLICVWPLWRAYGIFEYDQHFSGRRGGGCLWLRLVLLHTIATFKGPALVEILRCIFRYCLQTLKYLGFRHISRLIRLFFTILSFWSVRTFSDLQLWLKDWTCLVWTPVTSYYYKVFMPDVPLT